ncbi:MBL fold metallo-hydrolase, partial [Siminovitchia fortis]|uniref:MBL fold metallo-hydrolase n=1 Tax=Siminovitchia fortis TaxID=254758 RepID=UPI0036F33A8A
LQRHTLIPFLKSKPISRIHKLILTHTHPDHIAAPDQLIPELHIPQILITPNSSINPIIPHLLNKPFKQNIPLKEVKPRYPCQNKSASFHFIYPFHH